MGDNSDYCHLHVHSDFSLQDGAAQAKHLASAARDNGHVAVAITDHGTVSGVPEFYKACKKYGVKPIIGCEMYVAPGFERDAHRHNVVGSVQKKKAKKKSGEEGEGGKKFGRYSHLTVLAMNDVGWRNLSVLTSIAELEGFYYRPRSSWRLLADHSDGLIVLSGCMSGPVAQHIRSGNLAAAEDHARRYLEVFGDRYYMELMPDLVDGQGEVNRNGIALARRLGVRTVATADVHYIDKSGSVIQEIMHCVNSKGMTLDRNRTSGFFIPPVFFFKSTEMMRHFFRDEPKAVTTTREIADRCSDVKLFPGQYYLPKFDPPEGMTSPQYFQKLCWEGLSRRYDGAGVWANSARLKYEMRVIEELGFVDYFLVVHDFVAWARSQGIPVGPGRGSAAGSLVSYCLWVTDIDPIRYGLLFERFMNPQRVSMPDIDIDFCDRNRDRVIQYVRDKYGEDAVAQIITFGQLKARSAIRDVGRVLGIPLNEVDRIAKMVPEGQKPPPLSVAIESVQELKKLSRSPEKARLLRLATQIEGMRRQTGKHAAGVVIGDRPLIDRIPLRRVGSAGKKGRHTLPICTAFTMEEVEEVGLLKMDFLGLSTLTHINDTLTFVREWTGVDITSDMIPVRDSQSMSETAGDHQCPVHRVMFSQCRCCDKTLELLRRADTNGVFQVESPGMRRLLMRMLPDRFDDLVAIVALYRPGPLKSEMDQTYVKRKNNEEKIEYEHPALEEITKDTYGVWCYQEQLMQLSVALAGFSMPEADNLRKATAKKKASLMDEIGPRFISGCVEHSKMSKEDADKIWKNIVHFSEYSFNKSHSAAYAMIGWLTAWLKANYPIEFMAALMTVTSGDTDKLQQYVREASASGIRIVPPDVNLSSDVFSIRVGSNGSREILYGLAAVKGIGAETAASIVRGREESGGGFGSILQFCECVASVTVSEVEILVKADAFRSTGVTKAEMLTEVAVDQDVGGAPSDVYERPIDTALRVSRSRRKCDARQGRLFDMSTPGSAQDEFRKLYVKPVDSWSRQRSLRAEFESLGFYLTGHPLDERMEEIERYTNMLSAKASSYPDCILNRVKLCGIIMSVRSHIDKNENEMGFLSLEDPSGSFEAVAFTSVWSKVRGIAVPGSIVIVTGDLDREGEIPSVKISWMCLLDDAEKFGVAGSSGVAIGLRKGMVTDEMIEKLKKIVSENSGSDRIIYYWIELASQECGPEYVFGGGTVNGTSSVRHKLAAVLGEAGHVNRTKR